MSVRTSTGLRNPSLAVRSASTAESLVARYSVIVLRSAAALTHGVGSDSSVSREGAGNLSRGASSRLLADARDRMAASTGRY